MVVIDSNEDRILLNSITKACTLKNDRVMTRFLIKKGLLNMMMDQLGNILMANSYLCKLYRALLITTYFRLFRISEVVYTEAGHTVLAKDVHVGRNKDKLMFILHTSKTHNWGSKPQIIKIASVVSHPEINSSTADEIVRYRYCPFQMIKEYLQVRKKFKSDSEQFFVFEDRSRVTATHFRDKLKQSISRIGLDDTLYSGHGLCVGRACDLFLMGLTVETIKKLGRWHSNAVYTYLRHMWNAAQFLFAGNIQVKRSLFIIGDVFLNGIYNTLQEAKVEANDNRGPMPYMYDYYNLFLHIKGQLNKATLSNILNSLIKGLNEEKVLPQHILMIPDWDILKLINYYGYGISGIIGCCLNWLISEINRAIEGRKDHVWCKRPGAVLQNEPKILWVKVLDRPMSQPDQLFSARGKFNTILQDITRTKSNHHVVDPEHLAHDNRNFMPDNTLSAQGQCLFWLDIDLKLESLDYEKFALVEQPHTTKEPHNYDSQYHCCVSTDHQHSCSVNFGAANHSNRNYDNIAQVWPTNFKRC